ncbi:MAG: hypothetical protein HZA89_17505 [Verrucomicrobia bacterium]|nr:hypothetical protein [Verrucomicrobiota bacterium]
MTNRTPTTLPCPARNSPGALWTVVALLMAAWFDASPLAAAPVSFSRDIAPIFAKQCVVCHGPDKSKGDYRLNTFESALKPGASHAPPILPGKPAESELLRLLTAADPDDRMPQKADALPPAQIKLIERWIKEGAKFDGLNPKAPLAALAGKITHPKPPETYSRPVPITALAFNPAGTELAASGYREITIWSATTGKLLRRLKDLPQQISSMAYSPDGALLAAACGSPGEAGEVRLLNPANGKNARLLATLADAALVVRFSPDGKRLAAGGADNAIRVFEVSTGKEALVIQQHADWVMDLAFSPDGARLASASRDRSARIYDARTGEFAVSFLGHDAPVLCVAFNEDGTKVFSAGRDRKIAIWNPATGKSGDDKKKTDITGFESDILKLAYVSGHLFSTAADGAVREHDAADRRLLRTLTGHRDWVYALAAHPPGKRLATGSHDGEVRLWNLDTGEPLLHFTAAPGLLTAKKSK